MLSSPDFKQKQIILALLSHGHRLSFKNDNVIITNKDKEIIHQSTCYRLFSLFIVGHLTVTTGLIQRAKKFGFSILFMSHNLKPYVCFNSSAEGNILLRRKQYEYNSLEIAKHLVHNKIHNQIYLLKKIRNKETILKRHISSLEKYKNKLELENLTIKEILGLEGISSKIYFQNLFKDYRWKARRPRVKMDITNALQDIGYTLLFNFIEGLTGLYGFDIYQGVYHKNFYQRKSLICDLVEPFRPLIDYRIRKAYQLKQIKKNDFILINKQFHLFGKNSLPYLKFFIEELILNKDEIFKYIQTYYRSFIRSKPILEYPYFNLVSEQKRAV